MTHIQTAKYWAGFGSMWAPFGGLIFAIIAVWWDNPPLTMFFIGLGGTALPMYSMALWHLIFHMVARQENWK